MERTFYTPEMRQFCVIFEKQFLVASRVREIMNLKSKPNEKQFQIIRNCTWVNLSLLTAKNIQCRQITVKFEF